MPLSITTSPENSAEFAPPLESDNSIFASLMITRRCNMTCAHCSVASGPRVKDEPARESLLQIVRDAKKAGVSSLLITGGEPMLHEELVLDLLRECRALGIATSITSNGFWGKKEEDAARRLGALRQAGLQRLTISYDRYHAAFQGAQPAVNIVRAAGKFPVNINIARTVQDDVADIVQPFENLTNAHLRFYELQPVGRAAELLDAEEMSDSLEGFCSACAFPSITDDNRVLACNGPAYFSPPHSALVVGDLKENSLPELVARHQSDSILDTIRTFGPSKLRDELRALPGFEAFPLRPKYHGMCDLCRHLTSDANAMTALRKHLDLPRARAERVAVQRIMKHQRGVGGLNRHVVNSLGASRAFFELSKGIAGDEDEILQVLARADLDWNEQSRYIEACGLAPLVFSELQNPAVRSFVPGFVFERLQRRAIADSISRMGQKSVLARIAEAARGLAVRAVVLKGGALLALEDAQGRSGRSSSDLDVWIEPDAAQGFRRHLLQNGFTEKGAAVNPEHNHLPSVFASGVMVEIHVRFTHQTWKLPAERLLDCTQPLPGFDGLETLDAASSVLHAIYHNANHGFIMGLRLAHDIERMMSLSPMDWARLEKLVEGTKPSRLLWASARVLADNFGVAFPEDFLSRAPRDDRQRALEHFAASLLLKPLMPDENSQNRSFVSYAFAEAPLEKARLLGEIATRRLRARRFHHNPLVELRQLRRFVRGMNGRSA